MTEQEKNEILNRAIRVYGFSPQIDMCIEEMSELIKAFLKLRRLPPDELETKAHARCTDDILLEIADVQIMLDQMKIIFRSDCKHEEHYKLKRLRKRLGRME